MTVFAAVAVDVGGGSCADGGDRRGGDSSRSIGGGSHRHNSSRGSAVGNEEAGEGFEYLIIKKI